MDSTVLDYGILFDLVEMPIFVHDAETGQILDVNRKTLELWGCTLQEIRGFPIERFASNQAGFTGEIAMERLIRASKGEKQTFDWQARDASGKIFWIQVSLQPSRVDGRKVVLALCRDISREKQQEIYLFESEARYRSIVEGFDGLIYTCSDDFKIEFMNQKLIERTGRNAVGEDCFKVLHNRDTVCPWCVNERIQRGETVRWELKSPLDNRWYFIVNTPVKHADGRTSKQAMILDIHDRKQAAEEKLQIERRMQKTQKVESLGHLAGGVAHDFNNLLLVMIGQMDLALNGLKEDSPFRQNLLEGMKAAQRAAALCKQMLVYAGKGLFLPQKIDLNAQILDMESLLRISVSRNNDLVFSLFPKPLIISGDISQMQQIILNLILNASEALEKKPGRVNLTTGEIDCDRAALNSMWLSEIPAPGRFAFLEVSDSGCGINAEHLPRIFDPFFSTKFTGRGLGLAAVLGIVRSHHGAIQVTSQPGQGTTIRVLFPLEEDALNLPENLSPRLNAPLETVVQHTLLLVDDEQMVLDLTAELLETLGYKTFKAKSGEEAVKLLERNDLRFDAVLLDLTMPGMSGNEIFGLIKRIVPDLPVILSSGYHEDDSVKELFKRGLAGFLPKPYLLGELAALLSQAIKPKPE